MEGGGREGGRGRERERGREGGRERERDREREREGGSEFVNARLMVVLSVMYMYKLISCDFVLVECATEI